MANVGARPALPHPRSPWPGPPAHAGRHAQVAGPWPVMPTAPRCQISTSWQTNPRVARRPPRAPPKSCTRQRHRRPCVINSGRTGSRPELGLRSRRSGECAARALLRRLTRRVPSLAGGSRPWPGRRMSPEHERIRHRVSVARRARAICGRSTNAPRRARSTAWRSAGRCATCGSLPCPDEVVLCLFDGELHGVSDVADAAWWRTLT